LKPGETYELKEQPRDPFRARVSSGKVREPRFWLLLVINNVEYREDFKKENIMRELPAVVHKREGPSPYEIRDSENQRVRIRDLEENHRYVIQGEVEETINIVGVDEQVEVIIGNSRNIQRTVQERTGIAKQILLTDEEGRRVPFSKVQSNATYRVMVDDIVWEQRTVQWGDQEKKIKFSEPKMFWGQIMKWTHQRMYLTNQEGVEVDLLKTSRSEVLKVIERWDVRAKRLSVHWRNHSFTLDYEFADPRTIWKQFREK
jgi:hypothetical protein